VKDALTEALSDKGPGDPLFDELLPVIKGEHSYENIIIVLMTFLV
jgi:hypothetical protein